MTDATGVIAQGEEDGLPVLYRYIDETPSDERRQQLQWLTVIEWLYDREVRNGMPPEDVNAQMVVLEETIEDRVVEPGFCEHAVSRTGNGKKEFSYYIHDRDAFIERFNEALAGQPVYPIEITFFHDPEWKDFSMIRSMAEGAPAAQG